MNDWTNGAVVAERASDATGRDGTGRDGTLTLLGADGRTDG